MRIVKYTSRFKRDYRREKSRALGKKLDTLLMEVVNLLAADQPLPRRPRGSPARGRMERSPRLPHSSRPDPHLSEAGQTPANAFVKGVPKTNRKGEPANLKTAA